MISDVNYLGSARARKRPAAGCCSSSTGTCAASWPGSASPPARRPCCTSSAPAPASGCGRWPTHEGVSAPAMSGYIDRLEAAGPRRAACAPRRTAAASASASPARACACCARPGRAARPGCRSGSRRLDRRRARGDRPRARAARAAPGRGGRVTGALAARRTRARSQPAQAPQLPPLLRRPGRVGQRHVDAEHRHRLARPRADPLAGGRRRAARSAVPAVHGVRPVRRRRWSTASTTAARDRDAGDVDGLRVRARRARARRARHAVGGLHAGRRCAERCSCSTRRPGRR